MFSETCQNRNWPVDDALPGLHESLLLTYSPSKLSQSTNAFVASDSLT